MGVNVQIKRFSVSVLLEIARLPSGLIETLAVVTMIVHIGSLLRRYSTVRKGSVWSAEIFVSLVLAGRAVVGAEGILLAT